MPQPSALRFLVSVLCLGLAACVESTASSGPSIACDADNGGITLPAGFCAVVFADLGAPARHIAVRPNGDVLVALYAPRRSESGGGVLALRDTTGDGRADVRSLWGPPRGGSGIAVRGDHVWFATDNAILRFTLPEGELEPSGPADTIVSGLPDASPHAAKSIALTSDGAIFVNIGSPSNSCQQADRTAEAPGLDPCPQLETRAGIWRFDAERTGQIQSDGRRWATGIRNAVAIGTQPRDGRLYAMQHGRDQLSSNWGALFDAEASAEKPAEELLLVDEGDDFGWPYCYYDPDLQRKVLAPEYGGDGQIQGRCSEKEGPLFAFPAHWAPDGLLFYTGSQFPDRYAAGLFIAFHGSWNRAPLPQAGYNVVFLPFNAGAPLAGYEIFADGFAGEIRDPQQASHRPVGLAEGPDGSLFITDDVAGRIWRVFYRGE